jgi:hypothetical protein
MSPSRRARMPSVRLAAAKRSDIGCIGSHHAQGV